MELYEHQEQLLATLTEHDQWGIFWEARTMKTLPTLLHMTNLMMEGKALSALVIAPKAALGAWKRDISKFTGTRKAVCKNIKLVNYQLVWRREEYDQPFDIVVLDECHNISNRTSKQTKFIMKYATRSTYRYILSGTPIGQGRLHDLYTQMEFLKPKFFGKWQSFEAKYCVVKQLSSSFVKIVVGYRNKEELLERVGTLVSSLRLQDVVDLPESLADNVIPTPRPNSRYMTAIREGYIEDFDTILQNPAVKMMKYRQIASGFFIDEKGVTHDVATNKAKPETLNELLDELSPEKVVIFCEFKHSIQAVKEVVRLRADSYLILDGSQMDKECWTRFQANPHIRVMICQYESANAGIDLYTAHHMIFYEPTVRTISNEQARARITGAQQRQSCMYHWLISENSIEEQIYETLKKKTDFTTEVFSRWDVGANRG